jgi:hypothetical protein
MWGWGSEYIRAGLTVTIHLFDPILTMAEDGGPMNTSPSEASSSANLAFSLKNP